MGSQQNGHTFNPQQMGTSVGGKELTDMVVPISYRKGQAQSGTGASRGERNKERLCRNNIKLIFKERLEKTILGDKVSFQAEILITPWLTGKTGHMVFSLKTHQ